MWSGDPQVRGEAGTLRLENWPLRDHLRCEWNTWELEPSRSNPIAGVMEKIIPNQQERRNPCSPLSASPHLLLPLLVSLSRQQLTEDESASPSVPMENADGGLELSDTRFITSQEALLNSVRVLPQRASQAEHPLATY